MGDGRSRLGLFDDRRVQKPKKLTHDFNEHNDHLIVTAAAVMVVIGWAALGAALWFGGPAVLGINVESHGYR